MDSRSRLELFLAGGGRSGGSKTPTALDVNFDASGMSEFGDVADAVEVSPSDSDSQAAGAVGAEAEDGGAAGAKDGAGQGEDGWAKVLEEMGEDGGEAVEKDAAGQGEYGWARVLEEMADGADRADGECACSKIIKILLSILFCCCWHFAGCACCALLRRVYRQIRMLDAHFVSSPKLIQQV